jgi:hypothetical protein
VETEEENERTSKMPTVWRTNARWRRNVQFPRLQRAIAEFCEQKTAEHRRKAHHLQLIIDKYKESDHES